MYNLIDLGEMLETDKISAGEQGFMQGYLMYKRKKPKHCLSKKAKARYKRLFRLQRQLLECAQKTSS